MAHSQPAWLYAPNCSRRHTPSLLDCKLTSKLSRRSQGHSRARSQIHSQLHSMTHSQPAWQYAPKYTSEYVLNFTPGYALQDAPNCTRSHTPSLLDCTLPSKLSRHSHVHFEYAPMYTSESLSRTLPIAVDGTLPAYLALRSQVHSQEGRQFQSHLTICSHVCSCMLDPETCWVADARHREAWGWWCMADSVWRRAVGGVWRVAGGRRRCWPKSWRRSIW